MSHTTTIKTKIKNLKTFEKIAKTNNVQSLGYKRIKLYSSEAIGFAYQIPGWKYPIIIQNDGSIVFDNYNNHWGHINDLNKLVGDYAKEIIKDYTSQIAYTNLQQEENEETIKITIEIE